MGFLLLEGGAEFGGQMAEADEHAIILAGGFDAPIRILPTAAAPDHNEQRVGENALRWFWKLGARNVEVVNVLDQASANDPVLAASLRTSRLIYLPGGFPHHLGVTLSASRTWEAILEAYAQGAVIAGSSAGAMVLAERYYDPYEKAFFQGLNLLPRTFILPHHNRFGKSWAATLHKRWPDYTLLGIDEQTGLLSNAHRTRWRVLGGGTVTVYRQREVSIFHQGQEIQM